MKSWARAVHAINPSKSVKAWESFLRRWKEGAGAEKWAEMMGEQIEEKQAEDAEKWKSGNYYYDKTEDMYLTHLTVCNESIRVPGDVHRAMREAYSNWDGSPASINAIARQFVFPRAWFDEYRRKHGWTHDMDPFTDEVIAEADTDDLVADLILKQRQRLHKKHEAKKWAELELNATKWAHFEDTVLEILKNHIQSASSEVPILDLPDSDRQYAVVLSPTDLHYGKYGWVDELGEAYDLEEARKRLMETTADLISRFPGRPEKIIVSTGSDWFHVDNSNATTTRGTAQDISGSPAQILLEGCLLAREHIDALRQVAPVEIVFMPGNHDRHSALTLMLYLYAAYEGIDDVVVNMSPRMRQYMVYGNTLLGFTHGDGAQLRKLPNLMAHEAADDWGRVDNRLWFSGHLHHQKVHEVGGCMLIQLPSLSGEDRYHHQKGYVMSKAGLMAHILDIQEGLVGSLFSPVVHD